MKADITNRKDIVLLVDTFYDQVRENEALNYIFNDLAKVDWESHLPRMYDFWASMLLGENGFTGNPMQKHVALSRRAPLTEKEFSEWLRLFTKTVNTLFEGPKAREAEIRAKSIAKLMLYKIQSK